jgi:uncharacterized repeat protein (TIGR01451 family)
MFFTLVSGLAQAAGTTYYVSSSGGSDDNDGLSDLAPFETIARVNTLDLEPGDRVLFKCGDTWQAEQLVIAASGTESDPILFGSYPQGCADKPILSGSLPITGWTVHAGDVYRAALSTDEFPAGINQLFRGGQRLTLGRWPNLDVGNGGYSFVDSHTSGSNQIVDHELPSGVNWAGAIIHLKNIRWSMIDRQVTGSSGSTLTLNEGFSCLISSWTTCEGWGYFINNHLSTLDQDGEWYYDASTNQVYLFSASGPPSDIGGSIILDTASNTRHGGVILGLRATYVVVENLEIKNWFNHGFSTLSSMREAYAYHHITLRDNVIKNVDAVGVHLRTSIWATSSGRDGERGGHHMTFAHNVIDGANHFGVTGYFAESTFEDNEIKNIALIKNLNKSALGCGITRGECTENGDGFRITVHYVQDSGHSNTLRYNRFEKIGYNGIDVFGPHNTIANNFITQACYSKADCGGVRTFGRDNLSATFVHDVSIVDNIIVDIPGNVDGCHASRPAFGIGLYIDHYSRDVEVRGNTVISTTITGILYQNSTGQIHDNTVYNAASGTAYAGNVSLSGSAQATLKDNIIYGLTGNAWTMYSSSLSNFTASDDNYLFQPYVDEHIAHGPAWTRYTFTEWKDYSGLESNSKTNWFTLGADEPPLSRVFYNDTVQVAEIDLGSARYLDLDQNEWVGSMQLQPYTSRILIYDGQAAPDLSPSTKTASATGPSAGELVTYTIRVSNLSGPMTHTVALTDVVPSALGYVSGTLRASSGTWDDALAPTLTWAGVLSPTPTITITYAVTVPYVVSGTATLAPSQAITNAVIIAVPGSEPIVRTAMIIANPYRVHLPLMRVLGKW